MDFFWILNLLPEKKLFMDEKSTYCNKKSVFSFLEK